MSTPDTLREAAQAALEAMAHLIACVELEYGAGAAKDERAASDALRYALATPAQAALAEDRKPLSDEEIDNLVGVQHSKYRAFARAIERAHGIHPTPAGSHAPTPQERP